MSEISKIMNPAWKTTFDSLRDRLIAAYHAFYDIADDGTRPKDWSAHRQLRFRTILAEMDDIHKAWAQAVCSQLPAEWKMGQWGLRLNRSTRMLTWAGQGGKGQNGISFPLNISNLARLTGFLMGLAQFPTHKTQAAQDWAALTGREKRENWKFLFYDVAWNYTTSPWIPLSLPGTDPMMAYVRGLANGNISMPETFWKTGKFPATCFAEGYKAAQQKASKIAPWSGAWALWAAAFSSPAAKSLLGKTVATPTAHNASILFRSQESLSRPLRGQETLPENAAITLLTSTQAMARLARLGQLVGKPQPKTKWVVWQDKHKPAIEVSAWSPESAFLHAGLLAVLDKKIPAHMHTWKTWPAQCDEGQNARAILESCCAPGLSANG